MAQKAPFILLHRRVERLLLGVLSHSDGKLIEKTPLLSRGFPMFVLSRACLGKVSFAVQKIAQRDRFVQGFSV